MLCQGRAPDVMLERPGPREDTGQVRGDEKDPFPILGTLYVVRDLVCIGRKDRKSTVLRLMRRTKGPEFRSLANFVASLPDPRIRLAHTSTSQP